MDFEGDLQLGRGELGNLLARSKSAHDRDRWSQFAFASSHCNTGKIAFRRKRGREPMRAVLAGVTPVSFQGRFFRCDD
ncbi:MULTISPECIES: hypothetical protein [Bradyrhizobium]|jgi:hypothetical protein|uniref:hypothetical protein n=1 Tax=Bradyrhizobium TaxID=374 RepID=UPI001028D451|nr:MULTISPECIES: hypothetical protein [Bradyrhizobium]MBO4222053.1 hypothetical protein [Bradyrhizobium neotropicale]